MSNFVINKDLPSIAEAYASGFCYHCHNARGTTLCEECARCYGPGACGDSPFCTIRDSTYDGTQERNGITDCGVRSVYPVGEKPQPQTTQIKVTFRNAMDVATLIPGNFQIEASIGDDPDVTDVTVDDNETSAILVHEPLPPGIQYRVRVAVDVLSKKEADPLDEEYVSGWFETLPVTVVATSPAPGAVDVPVDYESVSVTFENAMKAGTVTSDSVYIVNNAGSPFGPSQSKPPELSEDGKTATLTFSGTFGSGLGYKIKVTSDCADSDGNKVTAYTQPQTWICA